MRSIVITGASTGIGHAAAGFLLARGFRVFGSVRRQADALRLQDEFGCHFVPLIFDVTDEAAVIAAADQVRAMLGGEALAGLVNNAGIAVSGALIDLTAAEFRKQLDVNVVGTVIATNAFAPLLGVDPDMTGPRGRIVMMSSLSGQFGHPLLAPYTASKFALEGLAECLRRELMMFGIDVLVIAAGPVRTPLWDKAEVVDLTRFGNSPFLPPLLKFRDIMRASGRSRLDPKVIARLIHKALTDARPRARMVVTPAPLQNFIVGLLPARWADRAIARQLGLTYANQALTALEIHDLV